MNTTMNQPQTLDAYLNAHPLLNLSYQMGRLFIQTLGVGLLVYFFWGVFVLTFIGVALLMTLSGRPAYRYGWAPFVYGYTGYQAGRAVDQWGYSNNWQDADGQWYGPDFL